MVRLSYGDEELKPSGISAFLNVFNRLNDGLADHRRIVEAGRQRFILGQGLQLEVFIKRIGVQSVIHRRTTPRCGDTR